MKVERSPWKQHSETFICVIFCFRDVEREPVSVHGDTEDELMTREAHVR